MKRLHAVRVLVFTTLLATPFHAMAEEIRIVRGSLRQPLNFQGDLHVQGTSGVRIDATLDVFVAGLGWSRCELVPICQPGDVVSLRADYLAAFPPLRGSGQVAIQGQTYGLFSEASADLQFDGAVVLPAFSDAQTVELSAPFAFSGSLQVPNRREPGTSDVFDIHGSGVATILLARSPFHQGWLS